LRNVGFESPNNIKSYQKGYQRHKTPKARVIVCFSVVMQTDRLSKHVDAGEDGSHITADLRVLLRSIDVFECKVSVFVFKRHL